MYFAWQAKNVSFHNQSEGNGNAGNHLLSDRLQGHHFETGKSPMSHLTVMRKHVYWHWRVLLTFKVKPNNPWTFILGVFSYAISFAIY